MGLSEVVIWQELDKDMVMPIKKFNFKDLENLL